MGRYRTIYLNASKNGWPSALAVRRMLGLVLGLLFCDFPVLGQSQPPLIDRGPGRGSPRATEIDRTGRQDSAEQQLTGTIGGTVVDRTGGVVAGARVKLSRGSQPASQDVTSDTDGHFSFGAVPPGPFQLTIAADGFATQNFSGELHPGENYSVPAIALAVATASTEVQVSLSPSEEAEAEIKDEEKQRVLGVVPNFYVTYNHAAVPLKPKQKFELAWKEIIDPLSFGVTAAVAGIEQGTNAFGGYGQGAQGYGKRYGASYADLVTSTFIGSAMLPSLLKQDPRYFYKGTGSIRSRILYALATSVVCKGDNGHWQANYSAIAGSLASGGISNLYYPEADRNGAALTFEKALIGIGSSAATNLLQEFVIRKLTPHAPNYTPAKP
jgi:Carboxypeptidase regulatory-like domain